MLERNTIADFGGTHAWAMFVSPESRRGLVVDPAQGFVGTKKDGRRKNADHDYYLSLT